MRRFLEGDVGLLPGWGVVSTMIYGGVMVMVGLRVDVSLSAREVSASGSIWLSLGWGARGGELPGVLLGAGGLRRSFASGAFDGAGPDGGSVD